MIIKKKKLKIKMQLFLNVCNQNFNINENEENIFDYVKVVKFKNFTNYDEIKFLLQV